MKHNAQYRKIHSQDNIKIRLNKKIKKIYSKSNSKSSIKSFINKAKSETKDKVYTKGMKTLSNFIGIIGINTEKESEDRDKNNNSKIYNEILSFHKKGTDKIIKKNNHSFINTGIKNNINYTNYTKYSCNNNHHIINSSNNKYNNKGNSTDSINTNSNYNNSNNKNFISFDTNNSFNKSKGIFYNLIKSNDRTKNFNNKNNKQFNKKNIINSKGNSMSFIDNNKNNKNNENNEFNKQLNESIDNNKNNKENKSIIFEKKSIFEDDEKPKEIQQQNKEKLKEKNSPYKNSPNKINNLYKKGKNENIGIIDVENELNELEEEDKNIVKTFLNVTYENNSIGIIDEDKNNIIKLSKKLINSNNNNNDDLATDILFLENIVNLCQFNIKEKIKIKNLLQEVKEIDQKFGLTNEEKEKKRIFKYAAKMIADFYLKNLRELILLIKQTNTNKVKNELIKKYIDTYRKYVNQRFIELFKSMNSNKSLFNEVSNSNSLEAKKSKKQKGHKYGYSKNSKTKKLIYDNSYLFKNKKENELNIEKQDLFEPIKSSENLNNLSNKYSYEYSYSNNQKESKERKFLKLKGRDGKRKLSQMQKFLKNVDDEENNSEDEERKKLLEENKKRKEELRERKLNGFLETIKKLRENGGENLDEELRIFIDDEIDKLEYTEEKKIEIRKNNFYNNLEYFRNTANCLKDIFKKKLQFHSPVNFLTKPDLKK